MTPTGDVPMLQCTPRLLGKIDSHHNIDQLTLPDTSLPPELQHDPEATGTLDYSALMKSLLDDDMYALYSAGAPRAQLPDVIRITPQ
jgi:hypothetical protein